MQKHTKSILDELNDLYIVRDKNHVIETRGRNVIQSAIHLFEQNIDKINWDLLSENPNAIHILEKNMDKINCYSLSRNPNAIHLLEKNIEKNTDKIDWYYLSRVPNVIHLLEKHIEKIDWHDLCENPNAIHLLEKNIDKIDWDYLSQNPNIFTYDYNKMKKNRAINGVIEELTAKVFHPHRLLYICEKYNIEFDDLMEIY